jgi:hypothetical protein
MKKPAKSSMRPERAILLERPPYTSPYGSPETLEHMKNCEAREWIARFKKKTGELGLVPAQSWWAEVCSDIEKRRGAQALADLRDRMNKERKNVGEKRT